MFNRNSSVCFENIVACNEPFKILLELRQAENDWIKINQSQFQDNNKLKDLKNVMSIMKIY